VGVCVVRSLDDLLVGIYMGLALFSFPGGLCWLVDIYMGLALFSFPGGLCSLVERKRVAFIRHTYICIFTILVPAAKCYRRGIFSPGSKCFFPFNAFLVCFSGGELLSRVPPLAVDVNKISEGARAAPDLA